jgi:hypothetical protein
VHGVSHERERLKLRLKDLNKTSRGSSTSLYRRLAGTKKFVIAMLLVMTAGTELVTFIIPFLLHHHCAVMPVSLPRYDRGLG